MKLIAALLVAAVPAGMAHAAGQRSQFVVCDNGLRCFAAPCPSRSALDLETGAVLAGVSVDTTDLDLPPAFGSLDEALYRGTIVIAGTAEQRILGEFGRKRSETVIRAETVVRLATPAERAQCSTP